MNLFCILGHNWSFWKYVKASGRYDEMLKRTCHRCGKVEFYTGTVEIDEKGRKVPHKK
jgi:hypothetical protein